MQKLIETIVGAIADKKGKNILSLDLTSLEGTVCDAFVICNADSTTQVAAIADSVYEKVLTEVGEKPAHIEGEHNALWIAMDYGNVIVHIFQSELRDFYRLEQLWADAKTTHYASEE